MSHRNPTLYHAASSYYSMVARYSLALSGIDYQSHLLDIHKKREQLQDWYVAINPAMTVPTLVTDDKTYTSSTAIVQFAIEQRPQCWIESTASSPTNTTSTTSTTVRRDISALVDSHDAFAVERLTFNALMKKLPPLRWLFPKMLQKICDGLAQEIEQGRSNAADVSAAINIEALQAKLALNQSRLAYFTGEPLGVRQERQIALAQTFVRGFGQAPRGPWLFGDQPSHADVVFIVFLARLRMVGLLEPVQVPEAFVDWLEQKTQTQAFKNADVWVKLQPLRLMSHR